MISAREAQPHILLAVVLSALVACAFLGQRGATLEQQFFEVDKYATLTMKAATAVIQEPSITVPDSAKSKIVSSVRGLRVTRANVVLWVRQCGGKDGCTQEAKIILGIESMRAAADLISQLVMEAQRDG